MYPKFEKWESLFAEISQELFIKFAESITYSHKSEADT